MNGENKTPDLRIAIISDVHIGFLGHINPNYYGHGQVGDQSKWFEYALGYFKERGVDAVVIPGDMANACAYGRAGLNSDICAVREMAECGEIFRKVFDGTDTQLVTIYGNHDNLCQYRERLNGGSESPWEAAFGEPYAHIVEKEVKGFKFVGANWGYEAEARDVIRKASEDSGEKPVFYIQHGVIKRTTHDSFHYDPNAYETGRENISDLANVIALTGHTHAPITDERTIWQSEDPEDAKCTVISCSTFNYGDSVGDLIRGENLMTKHAMYLTVTGKEINIERLSFWTDEMIALAKGEKSEPDFGKCTRSAGADWHFEIGGERVMDINKRAALAKAPEFAETAVAGLGRSDTYAIIYFPAAIPLESDDDMIHSYCAEALDFETGELVSFGQIAAESHIDHSSDHFADYYEILLADLKPDTKYTFKVYARDCYQKCSTRPIIHIGKTLPEKRERLY